MTNVLHWALFLWFALVAVAVMYVHVARHPSLGSGRSKLVGLALGVVALWAAVGILFADPLAWYAALAVSAYNVLEGLIDLRVRLRGNLRELTTLVNLGFPLVNMAFIGLLFTPFGRRIFGGQ
jgi:hypothetical protein